MQGRTALKRWVALGCALVASIALYFTFFRRSDEDRIKETLGELASIVAVKQGDTLLSRLGRIRSGLKEVVTDDVRVDIAELHMDVSGRDKLEENAAKAGLMYQTAECAFTSISVKVDPGGMVATADAVALVTANRGGERKVDRRDVHFLLHRQDGVFRISTIDVASPKEE